MSTTVGRITQLTSNGPLVVEKGRKRRKKPRFEVDVDGAYIVDTKKNLIVCHTPQWHAAYYADLIAQALNEFVERRGRE